MKREQFVAALRTTLIRLDDYQNLRHSPLLPLLPLAPEGPNPVALQRYLIEAIDTLKRAPGSAQAAALLYYRYVEHLSQADVAFQLGISVRQLRRDQNNAIELLAEQVWREVASLHAVPVAVSLPTPSPALASGALHAEVDWLRRRHTGVSCQLGPELQKALAEAAVLAATYQVDFRRGAPRDAVAVALPPLVLRQTLLTLLQLLMPVVAHQRLTLTTTETQRTVTLTIALPAGVEPGPLLNACQQAHQVALQLLTPFHGAVAAPSQPAPAAIELILPKVAGIPVLVVDDNPDTCQLLQRYAAHSRYQVIPVTDGRQTVALAQQHAVQALVLDVMMPDLDGWDLLAQLRYHPATQRLPIAVCTVLPQQELARLLGATHFLQKPINQETFLETLTTLVAATARAPC